jgi:hypothetical protein
MRSRVGSVPQRRQDLLASQFIRLLDDLDTIASRQCPHHGRHIDSCPLDARFPEANVRIHGNPRENLHPHHLINRSAVTGKLLNASIVSDPGSVAASAVDQAGSSEICPRQELLKRLDGIEIKNFDALITKNGHGVLI